MSRSASTVASDCTRLPLAIFESKRDLLGWADVDEHESWYERWWRKGFDVQAARRLRYGIQLLKQRLRSGAHRKGNGTAAEKLNRRRYSRRKAQEELKKVRGHTVRQWPAIILAQGRVRPHRILDVLYPERRFVWRPVLKRHEKHTTIDLKNFSFVDDPIKTMSQLYEIASQEASITEGRLNFEDTYCLDIGAFLVLQEMEQHMLPVFSGGSISGPIKRVIDVVGLRKALRMSFPSSEKIVSIWPLPFRTRHPQRRTSARLIGEQTSEKLAADVIAALNEWHGDLIGRELSLEGERYVLKLTGEVVDNAERHSDPSTGDGNWAVAGFMARRRQNGQTAYRCHLGLLSTGATIAESMATASSATKRMMDEYVQMHVSHNLTEEGLRTVFALQDGVSRVGDALSAGRGGTGFMDVLDFFRALSATNRPGDQPVMAIVSGATCVRIAPPHLQGRAESGPGISGLRPPRELWFNQHNRREDPPDLSHVVKLPHSLGGTLITMAWTMDVEYLQEQTNGADRSTEAH